MYWFTTLLNVSGKREVAEVWERLDNTLLKVSDHDFKDALQLNIWEE